MKKFYYLALAALLSVALINCGNTVSNSANPAVTTNDSTSAKNIKAFAIISPVVSVGIINETTSPARVDIVVPSTTILTNMVTSITHTGASINPRSGAAMDFTNSVDYTVTAADGTQKIYTVKVTPKSNAQEITTFKLTTTNIPTGFATTVCRTGVMSETPVGGSATATNSIFVALYPGTDKTALVASFTTDGAQSVFIGANLQASPSVPTDFTNPVTYTVYAEDGSHTDYVVTVEVAPAGGGPLPPWFLGTNC